MMNKGSENESKKCIMIMKAALDPCSSGSAL